MADEKPKDSEDGKKKLPIVPIILGVLVVMLVAGGAVFATLMLTGAPSGNALQEELDAIESEAEAGGAAPAGAATTRAPTSQRQAPSTTPPTLMVTPNPSRLETLYHEMERPLTANLGASRRVMQVSIAIMTHYDQMVVNNILKHELAIRSALLSVLSNQPEEALSRPNFRVELAEELRLTINAVLEQFENFGGVETVFFTEFLIQ
jgi:flagellar FliL protein